MSFTHLDDHGRARMVDVTGKAVTRRLAEARCVVRTAARGTRAPVGELVTMAQVAGLQAAKQTASLIPLCHPIKLEEIAVEITPDDAGYLVTARAEITERTGVEMEALVAAGVAGLTLTQALLDEDPTTCVDQLTLWHKSGGRSGTWQRA